MEVVLESLRRLERELHGVSSAVEDVWDADVPKDENALSNRIKRHLDQDQRRYVAIANREAEVRSTEENVRQQWRFTASRRNAYLASSRNVTRNASM